MYSNVERKFKNKFMGAISFSIPLALSINTCISSAYPKPVLQSDLSKMSKFFVKFSSKNPCDRVHQHSALLS